MVSVTGRAVWAHRSRGLDRRAVGKRSRGVLGQGLDEGGPGSGNWGHRGIKGNKGGSMPQGGTGTGVASRPPNWTDQYVARKAGTDVPPPQSISSYLDAHDGLLNYPGWMSDAARQTNETEINLFENEYARQHTETALIQLNSKQGPIDRQYVSNGATDYVVFPEEIAQRTLASDYDILSHNHPSGTSFSKDDMFCIEDMGLERMEAVGPANLFKPAANQRMMYRHTLAPQPPDAVVELGSMKWQALVRSAEAETMGKFRRQVDNTWYKAHRGQSRFTSTPAPDLVGYYKQYFSHAMMVTLARNAKNIYGVDIGYHREQYRG